MAAGTDHERPGDPITVESTLIGRDHPAAVLRAEIERVTASHGGLVFVTGEAGIGKTTLVSGAVGLARQRGALVLNGSCWDSDSTPGYWPWIQVVRGLRRAATAEEWDAAAAAAGSGLPVLLGEAAAKATDAQPAFELHDAVTAALVSVSHHRPVVVVLDDLHWADPASVRLLAFAAQHIWFERLLVIGTYRDVEVEASEHPLRPLLLPMLGRATTVTLSGLDPAEVGALMARTAGREPDADLVVEVHRRTGGNPFFVEQSARLWHSGGSATAVSPGVRDALHRRLSLLPPAVADLLTGAAVLGREFHHEVLAATVSAPVALVDRLLDRAVTARLAVVLGSGRFAFAHDLVRETLYDDLSPDDARQRHAAVVRGLDRVPALIDQVFPADLARHAYLAGPALDDGRVVELLLAAAHDADNRMATEERTGHLRRALERSTTDLRSYVTVALELGGLMSMAGEPEQAWQVYRGAVDRARELDDDLLLAQVALTLHRTDPTGVGADASGLTAALVADAHRRLIGTWPLTGTPNRGTVDALARELARSFAAVARGIADDRSLLFGLWAWHNAIWGPGTAAERVELTDEIIAVAHRIPDPSTEHAAMSFRWVALLELGDPRFLEGYQAFMAMAERLGWASTTFMSLIDRSIVHTMLGRFADAEACLDQAAAMDRHRHAYVGHMVHHLRWALLLAQGRFDELDVLHRAIAHSGHPCPQVLATVTGLQRGDPPPDLDTDPLDQQPDFAALRLRLEALAAAATGDPVRCDKAHAALQPYAGQWMVSMYGCDVSGPADLWIAVLDAAQARWPAAMAGFEAARRSADRMQARPWSVEIRIRHADALAARGGTGDAEAAAALRDSAVAEAADLGMRHITGSTHPVPPATSAYEFRRDGAVWCLGYAGRTIHFPDVKGLRDLHALLALPGRPVPAVHLLNPAGGAEVVAASRLGGDPVLDDEAKARYKRRLGQLDEEIDRATVRGDARGSAALDRERGALLAELRAAAGLGGRTRRLGDDAERARKTVTARIRDTLRKLDERHPDLAAHLRETVSTGATCMYSPAQPLRWRL